MNVLVQDEGFVEARGCRRGPDTLPHSVLTAAWVHRVHPWGEVVGAEHVALEATDIGECGKGRVL